MNIDQLQEAHSRAYAAQALVSLPVAVAGPFLVFQRLTEPIRLRAQTTTAVLGIRNVGDEDCYVAGVSASEGVSVDAVTRSARLDGRSLQSHRMEIEIDSFRQRDSTGEATIALTVQSLGGGKRLVFETRIQYTREQETTAGVLVSDDTLVFEGVTVNGLRPFTVEAPGAKRVVLSIEDGPGSPQQHVMREATSGIFEAAIVLEECARYAYRFLVDDVPRPDEHVLDRVALRDAGTCSAIEVPRTSCMTLALRNVLTTNVDVQASSAEGWLHVKPARLTVRRQSQQEIEVAVDPSAISAGEYSGSIQLKCSAGRRESSVVPVSVRLTVGAPGPVPKVEAGPHDLGTVYFGEPAVRTLAIRNVGTGVLEGRVVSDVGSVTGEDFKVAAGPKAGSIQLVVHNSSEAPTRAHAQSVRLILETNSAASPDRNQPIVVRYHLALMRLAPASVEFPSMPIGTIREVQVTAKHGDGRPVEKLSAVDPLPPWVELQFGEKGKIALRIRGDRMPGQRDEAVSATITFKDAATRLTGSLPLAGKFLHPRATIEPRKLKFGLVRGTSKTLPLRVRNTGDGDLVVKEIVLDHDWLFVRVPNDGSEQHTELEVRVDARNLSPGHHDGVIELETNDRRLGRLNVPVSVTVL